MKDEKRALAMPSGRMVERNMTPEEKRRHREQLRRWRQSGEDED